jgi:ABC-type bacteriocin/lantibiotic exporter with double-glycine peptidase domain
MGDLIENFIIEIRVALECSVFTLIILKLSGAVSISWLWVLSPFLLVIGIIFILFLIFIGAKIYNKIKKIKNKKNE